MSILIACIISKCGPDISQKTLSILNLIMESIVAAMLVLAFRPTIASIKFLATDMRKKINKKELISIMFFKSLTTIGGGWVLIDLLYLFKADMVNSFIDDMIIKINGPVDYSVLILLGFLLCPSIDEVIFRSVIFKRISKKFNLYAGIAVSSIIFASINVGNGVIGALILGITNCIIYIKYKNIFMPILINFINNVITLATFIPFIGKDTNIIFYKSGNIQYNLIAGCLMLFVGLILFFRFCSKNKECLGEYNKSLKDKLDS